MRVNDVADEDFVYEVLSIAEKVEAAGAFNKDGINSADEDESCTCTWCRSFLCFLHVFGGGRDAELTRNQLWNRMFICWVIVDFC